MKKLALLCALFLAGVIADMAAVAIGKAVAHAQAIAQQQQPDAATLQRYLIEMQRARDERANDAVAARAEVARLTEEAAKLKAEIERLKAQPDGRSDGR